MAAIVHISNAEALKASFPLHFTKTSTSLGYAINSGNPRGISEGLAAVTLNHLEVPRYCSSSLGALALSWQVSPEQMNCVWYLFALHQMLNRSMEKEEERNTGKEGCIL